MIKEFSTFLNEIYSDENLENLMDDLGSLGMGGKIYDFAKSKELARLFRKINEYEEYPIFAKISGKLGKGWATKENKEELFIITGFNTKKDIPIIYGFRELDSAYLMQIPINGIDKIEELTIVESEKFISLLDALEKRLDILKDIDKFFDNIKKNLIKIVNNRKGISEKLPQRITKKYIKDLLNKPDMKPTWELFRDYFGINYTFPTRLSGRIYAYITSILRNKTYSNPEENIKYLEIMEENVRAQIKYLQDYEYIESQREFYNKIKSNSDLFWNSINNKR